MIVLLRVFFLIVLISMLAVTLWASQHTALWAVPSEVVGHPWFVACLFDAYWGFFTFLCWVYYRERSGVARFSWTVAILCFGNIAMAVYALIILFKLPTTATAKAILLRPA